MSLFGWMVVRRTSSYDGSPCDEAEMQTYTYVDRRTVDDPNKLRMGAESWHKDGTNHRVENGHICRDFPGRNRWVVLIPDSEALESFIDKYGEVIISKNKDGSVICYEIEIYDDYME